MKRLILISLFLGLTSCGYSSVNNEITGQVKKIVNHTPLLCMNHRTADISLGVMRNGVGSMSTEDVIVFIDGGTQLKTFQQAVDSGKLIKLNYMIKRFTFCVPDHIVQSIEILN